MEWLRGKGDDKLAIYCVGFIDVYMRNIFFYGVKLFGLTPFFFYAETAGVSHKNRKSKSKIGFRIFPVKSVILYP